METSLFIETDISKDVEQIAKHWEVPVETLNSLNKVYSETNSKLDADFEYAQSSVLSEDW